MDSYAARLILAAVLIAGATFSASLVGGANREADSEPPCTIQIVQTENTDTHSAALPCAAAPEEQTPVQEELWQTTYMTALQTSELTSGTEVTVFGTAGEELQRVQVAANGYASLQPLPPGSYTVWTAQLGVAQFLLKDNASVEARGGSCWSDGELLHLVEGTALKVECSFKRDELPADELRLTLQNEKDKTSSERLLSFEAAGFLRTQRTAFFADLTPGNYQLLVNGILWEIIEINDTPKEVKIVKLP